jgi:DNA-(apurinic or apyrimidinic site) lyase
MGVRVELSEGRARALSAAFGSVGLERVMEVEESLDPQLRSASEVARRWGAGPGSLCSLLTALISYRLAMRGEEWWACYRDFFGRKECPGDPAAAVAAVGEFLRSCRGGVIAREAKARRLERALAAAPALRRLVESPSEAILGDPRALLSALAAALGQDPQDKTIVFSLKMAYYACRGAECPGAVLPFHVGIPVDVRVSCVSHSSGLLEVASAVDPVRAIMSRPEVARRAWFEVSRGSGIPPLHLDSLIWIVGRAPRDLPPEEARAAISRSLGPVLGPLARGLAEELVLRPCR